MAEPVSGVVLTAFLFAQYVGEGMGFPNTPKGAYVCGYDKTSYQVTEAGVVRVAMVKGTPSRFVMRHLEFFGDQAGDYKALELDERSLSFSAANRVSQSIYFTVVIEDKVTGAIIECDPVIENEEPPAPSP